MTPAPTRSPTADAWGLTDGYHDARGAWRSVSEPTRAAIHAAMGVDPSVPARAGDARAPAREGSVLMLRAGQTRALSGPAELTLEDGTLLRVERALPAALPLGYHTLRVSDAPGAVRVIVSPGRCHLPADLSAWGWAAQLYATRSAAS